jgi:hypothetical protein
MLDDETAAYSRGCAQEWLHGKDCPEASAQKVLKAANAIVRAGCLSVAAAEV